ncbi:hypothetical protein [Parablautia muri]|uniref:Uncharacterized protein n=1 Tax=Parablautia muri TaxID=2320879 RepID=A0A9X5BGA3_9FIRM|nr:hypothetical protein [Parablautia muri]NBJ93231.1 hypothetical protein [Parablautia muri]
MLEGKALMDKLYEQPGIFRIHMRNKQYSRAKACYDTVRSVLVFLEADEGRMQEFFGERGERGAFLKEGLFDEEQVQKAYYECIRKGDTYENKRYEALQGEG